MAVREWYLLQTKVRREAIAKDNLERQQYRTWLPRLRRHLRRGTRIEPLFPGYLFVALDPTVDDFGPIRSTIGALRLVQFGAVFARLPFSLVDALRQHEDADGVHDAPHKPLKPGDRVDIVGGPMAGYQAIVSELRGRERVALLLDIAGRQVGVVSEREILRSA